MIGLRWFFAFVALLTCAPAVASAQSIPDGYYYKLSTEFRGSNMKLDVFNGGPKDNMTRLKAGSEPDRAVLADNADRGRLGSVVDTVSRFEHVSGYFQRRRERQRAASDPLWKPDRA